MFLLDCIQTFYIVLNRRTGKSEDRHEQTLCGNELPLLFSVISEISIFTCVSIYWNVMKTHICIETYLSDNRYLYFYPGDLELS